MTRATTNGKKRVMMEKERKKKRGGHTPSAARVCAVGDPSHTHHTRLLNQAPRAHPPVPVCLLSPCVGAHTLGHLAPAASFIFCFLARVRMPDPKARRGVASPAGGLLGAMVGGGGGPVGRALLLVPLLLGGLALLLQVRGDARCGAATRSFLGGLHFLCLTHIHNITQWTATTPPATTAPSLIAEMER